MNKASEHALISGLSRSDATDSRNALRIEKILRCELRAARKHRTRARVERRCGVELVFVRIDEGFTDGDPCAVLSESVRCALEGGKVARVEVLKQGGGEVDRDGVYFGVLEGGGEVVVEDLGCGVRDGEVFLWVEEHFKESDSLMFLSDGVFVPADAGKQELNDITEVVPMNCPQCKQPRVSRKVAYSAMSCASGSTPRMFKLPCIGLIQYTPTNAAGVPTQSYPAIGFWSSTQMP
ncbi:hypothetical protein C0992_011053 [Termitomyces sp. T32_za158]|nr:hypothetical protein C0992_011053 [Termitomyces sp. T32_za158]